MQVSFVMLIFYCFWTNFLGGGKLLEGCPLPPAPVEESQKHFRITSALVPFKLGFGCTTSLQKGGIMLSPAE